MHALLTILVPFAFVAAVTPVIRRLALQWKLGDKPNGRKIHTSTIPHLGGVGIVIGALGIFGAIALTDASGVVLNTFLKLIGPVTLIVVMGLLDDLKNLKPRQKLVLQVISALGLALLGFRLFVGVPLIDHNLIFVILLSSFYLVGISSSLNLVDGMDGLAAGLSFISALTFAALAVITGALPTLYLSLALAGACLGFLIHNFPPGKIFMGDTGSTFLGIILGIVACSFTSAHPAFNTFLAVCFVVAIPMLDTWLAIVRRLVQRQPVFGADSQHIHHVIHSFGFTDRQTVAILYLLQTVMALLGFLTMKGLVVAVVLGLAMMLITFLAFLRIMLVSPERARPATGANKFVHNSIPSLEK